ncbi:MAG: hypothetical protein VW862_08810, partial [Euryarchaeota archaeon]
MSEENMESMKQISFLDLIKNMFSARTLPHIVMIGVVSIILLALVSSQENFVSFAFISLSASYSLIAILSNNETVQSLIPLPTEKSDSKLSVRFILSFRITIVPILLSSVIMGLLWY